MMAIETQSVIAVAAHDLLDYGCPHCGYRSGYSPMSIGGTAVWVCGSDECGKNCCVLAEGITKSRICFGDVYPELQAHPRQGIPSHGRSDKKPKGGGEFFRSRGIGSDTTPGCFVCGGKSRLLNNIAAFVQCEEAGKRVAALFRRGARLDYREHEPDRVQVKVGACDAHLTNLKKLQELTQDGVITKKRIRSACS